MALWQWDIWLVPQKKVINNFRTMPIYMDQDWFEAIDWWENISLSKLELFFDSLLFRDNDPRASKDVKSWGRNGENEIFIVTQEEKITDVSIRLNVEKLNIEFVKAIVEFAENNDFVFFTLESNNFFRANLKNFLDELNKSKAALFVKDPEQFFESKNYLKKINKENRRKLK